MADAAILKNGHISATVWPIGTKFGLVMHIGLQSEPVVKISNFLKSKMADGLHLKLKAVNS